MIAEGAAQREAAVLAEVWGVGQAHGADPYGPPQEPVLTAHACPYPDLAESDPSICTLERMLFSELLGEDVELVQCKEGGRTRCQFQPN